MFSKVRDRMLKGVVAADLAMSDAMEAGLERLGESGARKVRVGARAMMLTGLGLLVMSDAAMATISTNYGIGGWIKNLVNDSGVPILDGVRWGFGGVGMVACGTGINKFIQMSKPNAQVQGKEAAMYTGGGGALMGVGYIADRLYESMTVNSGGSTSTIRTL